MQIESTSRGTSAPAVTVTFFALKEKPEGTRKQLTSWDKFFTMLANRKPPASGNKLDQPGWSPATFIDDLRKGENVEHVFALVFDFDAGTTLLEDALSVWKGCLACVHTSWSHTPEHPKLRLILPLSRAVNVDEHALCWRWGAAKVEAAGQEIDDKCKDAARMWFLPCRRDDHFRVVIQDGAPLDVDAVLNAAEVHAVLAVRPIEPIEAFEANRAYANAALTRECEAVAGATEGRRNDQLNRSAFSLGQLVAGGALDAQDVVSALHAAASACGLAVEEADRTIRSGMNAGARNPRGVPAAGVTTGDTATHDAPWDAPQPFAQNVDLPPSPWATSLPSWLWQWVQAESIATQTPEDLAALLALSVLATCCQRRYIVRVKVGWAEQLCVYVAVILPPGSRKSAVFRAASEPLFEWEAAQRLAIEAEMAEASTTVAIAEKKLRAAEARAGKDGDITAVDDALAAAREFAQAQEEVPTIPRLVTADATQEAVARLLNEQGGCISVMDAEGCGPVALMLGRYADGAAAVDVYLRGHAGDALRVDRVGREPIIVDNPRVSMGITMQPAVIEQLSERRELRGLGLLARVLWCHPVNTVGTRQVDPPPVPTEVAVRYRQAIHALLDREPCADGTLAEVVLSTDAWLVLRSFMEELEPRLGEDGDLAGIADWASKLAGAVARVAALLHIAGCGAGGSAAPISADTVTAAVRIGRYLLAHARKVLGQMGGGDPVLTDAKAVLHFLRERKTTEVSRRDLHQAMRKGYDGRFHRSEDLDAPLTLLAERGWVRLREHRDGGSKGRVSVIVSVNPRTDGTPQKAQKPQKVEHHEPVSTDAGPIEPIEAFEAHRVVEVACVMAGSSSVTIDADADDTQFDLDTERGRRAYNDYLCSVV